MTEIKKGAGWLKPYFADNSENKHTLIYGVSGAGKTVLLSWFLLEFQKRGYNVIIRDIGKSSELSILAERSPLRLFTLEGIKVIDGLDCDIEHIEFDNFDDVLTECDNKKINVISVPYHTIRRDLDRFGIFLNIWRDFFVTLVDLAFEYRINTPARIGIDEINNIAPSGSDMPKQLKSLLHELIISFQELRGNDMALIGSSMGITEVNAYIRKQADYQVFKKLAETPSKKLDLDTLKGIDGTVKSLKPNQFILVNPERDYSYITTIDLPDYRPRGRIYFKGKIADNIISDYADIGHKRNKMLKESIRLLLDNGHTQTSISKKLGVSQGYIWQILQN